MERARKIVPLLKVVKICCRAWSVMFLVEIFQYLPFNNNNNLKNILGGPYQSRKRYFG